MGGLAGHDGAGEGGRETGGLAGHEGASEGWRDVIEGTSSEFMVMASGPPLMVIIGREGRVGSVGFENSQLSKVAPSASKSMVSKLSKPSTTGNAHAQHSSTGVLYTPPPFPMDSNGLSPDPADSPSDFHQT